MRKRELTIQALFLNGLLLAFLLTPLAGVVVHQQLSEQEMRSLEKRAERIFAYDLEKKGELPRAPLTALSLAIAFHNHEGAKALLEKLEPSLRN